MLLIVLESKMALTAATFEMYLMSASLMFARMFSTYGVDVCDFNVCPGTCMYAIFAVGGLLVEGIVRPDVLCYTASQHHDSDPACQYLTNNSDTSASASVNNTASNTTTNTTTNTTITNTINTTAAANAACQCLTNNSDTAYATCLRACNKVAAAAVMMMMREKERESVCVEYICVPVMISNVCV